MVTVIVSFGFAGFDGAPVPPTPVTLVSAVIPLRVAAMETMCVPVANWFTGIEQRAVVEVNVTQVGGVVIAVLSMVTAWVYVLTSVSATG